MSAVEVVRIPVAPADAGALVEAVRRGMEGYLAPPACEGVEVLRRADGTEVIVVASWASVDAHDLAAAGPAAARFLDEVGGLAAGPPAVGFYERG